MCNLSRSIYIRFCVNTFLNQNFVTQEKLLFIDNPCKLKDKKASHAVFLATNNTFYLLSAFPNILLNQQKNFSH